MTGQEMLFFEDFRGAVRHLVQLLGGSKNVGPLLRPLWSQSKSQGWVNDCLNPDRDTKFDFEDITALLAAGRKAGIHCALWQLADEIGYERPQVAPERTARQELADKMAQAAAEFRRFADEYAAIERGETVTTINRRA